MDPTGLALPPSPELRGTSASATIPSLSLQKEINRLQSIAKYDALHPQALACSPPIIDSHASFSRGKTNGQANAADSQARTSLAAVAGTQGIALFCVARPHIPVMILSLASNPELTGGSVAALSFQPDVTRSLYLAAARGSSVLVWDLSGHSLQPFWGRLGTDSVSRIDRNSHLTSISWQSGSDAPWIAATCGSSVCFWDLRERPGATTFKPSLRFAPQRDYTAPFVQIACSTKAECGVLDAAGVLRIYDTRMLDQGRTSGSIATVQSFHHTAVGLSHFPTTYGSHWLTWGLDAVNEQAIVKVWGRMDTSVSTDTSDEYVLRDASPDKADQVSNISTISTRFGLVGQCVTENLACARVCPFPIEDHIVTVGLENGHDPTGSEYWHADLWRFSPAAREANNGSNFEKVITFTSKSDHASGSMGSIGAVRASELAISSSNAADSNLMVCSLTDKGIISTHVVPEAPMKGHHVIRNFVSSSGKENLRSFPLGPLRRFPDRKDLTFEDAAVVWAGQDETLIGKESVLTLFVSVPVEPSGILFDMETPTAYSKSLTGTGMGPMKSLDEVLPMQVSDDQEQDTIEPHDVEAFMEKIETDRIPCPRLCGATFGSRNGVLATFSNGDVKSLWSWWKKSDPSKEAATPGLIGGPAEKEANNVSGGITISDSQFLPRNQYPRNLKDLADMTSAAKDAQWGDQDGSDVDSTRFQTVGEQYFEEEGSDGSSSSYGDDLTNTGDSKRTRDMYDTYFGGSSQPLREPLLTDKTFVVDNFQSDQQTFGPSSDTLVPVVFVSHKYDELALNFQSIALAEALKFGDVVRADNIIRESQTDESESSVVNTLGLTTDQITSPKRNVLGLSPYRTLRPPNMEKIPRVKSDPIVSSRRALGVPRVTTVDEKGVHGGEYAVRPNMQESMVFLRKLFSHHQESGQSFPSLMSPPDSPMLPNSLVSNSQIKKSNKRKPREKTGPQAGVFSLSLSSSHMVSHHRHVVQRIREVCEHNAAVCLNVGEVEKHQVWDLLAAVVENRLHDRGESFDGWGNNGGDALGSSIVMSFLKYYELLGDVQMLSTIVSVLRGLKTVLPRLSLLDLDKDATYDAYIRQYSDLLFAWGLLNVRAELNKHLSIAVCESFDMATHETAEQIVSHCFLCPQCCEQTDVGVNYCRRCLDFAFRCMICDNAVRGLFTACELCGHGGHVEHLKSWFSSHSQCPSGCGCHCSSLGQSSQVVADEELDEQIVDP